MPRVKPNSIEYLPGNLSQSYMKYINSSCYLLDAMRIKRNIGSQYADYCYRMAKHVRAMFLITNRYIDQMQFNIEIKNSKLKKYLQSTNRAARRASITIREWSEDVKQFSFTQRNYFLKVICTLSKNNQILSLRKKAMTDLLLINTPLYNDVIYSILDFL